MRLFTYELTTGSIAISGSQGVTQISVQANNGGSCFIQGNVYFNGLASTPIEISNGESITVTTPTNSPLDGVIITHVSGTVDLLIGM